MEMAHCHELSSTDIAALFDELSEDEEPGVFESKDDGENEEPKREVQFFHNSVVLYYILILLLIYC